MAKQIILTGVKPTGIPHLGNYVGAIRPSLALAKEQNTTSFLFIADYHSLTTIHDPAALRKMVYEVSASWLACGLDPEQTIIYRQSDIPELFELNWILSCMTPKGLMNRAHSYKALLQENIEKSNPDSGINMGVYNYPILMSADILLFSTDKVPVSEDQAQHLEVARDIAIKFNHTFKTRLLKPPEALITGKLLPGLDGQKMSKSYNNYIPLFSSSKELKKTIMKIKTDSSPPKEPKDPEKSLLFSIYKAFASEEKIQLMAHKYKEGIGWGEVKETLYMELENHLSDKRKKYQFLMDNPEKMNQILKKGAQQAREKGSLFIQKIRKVIGISY